MSQMTEIILSQWVIALALGALCLGLLFFCLVPSLLVSSRVRKMKGAVGAMQADSAQLKSSLAAELSETLERLADKQIEASRQQQEKLGEQLTNSLRVPLDNVAKSLEEYGKVHSASVAKGVEDQIALFAGRLDEALGGQVVQAKELQANTLKSLETTIAAFQDMSRTMESTAKSATQSMVEDLRAGMSRAQEETSANMNELFSKLGLEVANAIVALQRQSEATTKAALEQQEKLSEGAQSYVESLTTEARAQTQAMEAASESMRGAGSDVADAVERIVEGMTGLISGAAQEIIRSGKGFTEIFEKSATLHRDLNKTASSIAASSKDIGTVVSDYRNARETMQSIVEFMRKAAETARGDASLTSEVVTRIEEAAAKLIAVQGQADDHLSKLDSVLSQAHGSFSTQLLETIRDLQEHMAKTPATHPASEETQRRSTEFDRMISDWVQATPRLKPSVQAEPSEEPVVAARLPLPASRVVRSK